MKRTVIAIAVSVSALFATPIFAGNEETAGHHLLDADLPNVVVLKASHCESKGANLPPPEYAALIKSCLAETSSPANVKAVALLEKKAYCDKNTKNKSLQGSEKDSYFTACMHNNEALVQLDLVNRGIISTNTDASIDFNNALRQLTGFVTAFLRTNPAGSQ